MKTFTRRWPSASLSRVAATASTASSRAACRRSVRAASSPAVSVTMMVALGSMPLGALLGGVVASLWGIPTVLIGVVAVMLAATPLVWRTVAGSLVGAYELAADAG